MNKRIIDLTNQRFGRLVAIEIDEDKSKKRGRIYWKCKCDCGNIVSTASYRLRDKRTQSCGCLNRERTSIANSKSNRIEFDTSLGCLRVYFNNCDDYFLCDTEDRDIAEGYCWHKDSNGYVQGNIHKANKKSYFHRMVMEKYHGNISYYEIDHINHITTDNRRFNLRLCTHQENILNRSPYSNTGYKSISYDKIRNDYYVQIDNKYIGRSKNIQDALNLRDEYYKNHPNNFRYNEQEDRSIINNKNIIHPFVFINRDN